MDDAFDCDVQGVGPPTEDHSPVLSEPAETSDAAAGDLHELVLDTPEISRFLRYGSCTSRKRPLEEAPAALASASSSTGVLPNTDAPEPDGPHSASEIHLWPRRVLSRLQEHFVDCLPRLLFNIHLILMTTHYSGSGASEESLASVIEAVASESGAEEDKRSSVIFYSACDIASAAQAAIMSSACRPLHFFADVSKRLPMSMFRRLERSRCTLKAMFERKCCEDEASATGAGRRAILVKYEHMFLNVVERVLKLSKDHKAIADDNCLCHATRCPVAPRHRSRFWLEIAGTTCVAFSNMSKKACGWLDNSSLPCIAWMFWLLVMTPNLVIHECVRRFDPKIFVRFLGSVYIVRSSVFCSSRLGVATKRIRRYTVLIRKDHGESFPFSSATLARAIFCKCMTDARLFFHSFD